MANTRSAAKALRQSKTKRLHNLFWKKRFRRALKTLKNSLDSNASTDILKRQESLLQKAVDKAAKEKVIHKNKAGRIKSKISKKVAAYARSASKPNTTKSIRKPRRSVSQKP